MLSLIAMDFFSKSPVLSMPILALGLFMSAFIAVAVRTALTDKRRIDIMASLPLEDGTPRTDAPDARPTRSTEENRP
jgi:hypothetical protein